MLIVKGSPDCDILLGLPSIDGLVPQQYVFSLLVASQHTIDAKYSQFSTLPYAFNTLFVDALNDPKVKTFAMLHGDIVPCDFWIDILIEEMRRLDADMVSAIVPIKTKEGVTSTAVAPKENPWLPKRRLTMKEVFQLPETFGAESISEDSVLMLNSGCFVINMEKPWVKSGVCFQFHDRIFCDPKGIWRAINLPEDWAFSLRVQELGGKVFATRKVKVLHRGQEFFDNASPWGEEIDPQLKRAVEQGHVTLEPNRFNITEEGPSPDGYLVEAEEAHVP